VSPSLWAMPSSDDGPMQEVAGHAVRDDIAHGQHRDPVSAAAQRVIDAHADALDRLETYDLT
jgi:hypothetical protein